MFLRNPPFRGRLSAGTLSRRIRRRRSGAAVLELALTLSLLFLVTFGLVEFGYYFYVKNTMEGAAREGCRAGIVAGGTLTAVNSAIQNQLQVAFPSAAPGYAMANYTITYTDSSTGSSVGTLSSMPIGDTLTVQLTATWGTVGAGFRPMALIGTSKQLICASSMRKEGD